MNCCNCICPSDPCRGPTGATGPVGPSGTSRIADFYNLDTGLIADNAAVILSENVNLVPADISHVPLSANITLITPGYYLISYDADASRIEDGLVGLRITANGIDVAISVSSAFTTAGNQTQLSSSFIFNNTFENLVINLVNDGGSSATFSNVNVVVQKLNI